MQRGRVRSACVRCRRQKLKCDPSLPCQLCVRSGVQCVSSTDLLHSPSDHTPGECSSSPITGKRKADILPRGEVKSQRAQHDSTNSVTQVEYLSTFRLVEQIFATRGKSTSRHNHSRHTAVPRHHYHQRRDTSNIDIQSILGDGLPPKEVTDILVATYMQAVHWYIPLLHGPTFRQRLSEIRNETTCSASDRPFLLLSVVVMLMGLQFTSTENMKKITDIISVDIPSLRAKFISSLEKNFLGSFDQYNQDWICFSTLLAIHYLLNQRPRRASVVMGSAIQAARDMRLDKTPVENVSMTSLEVEMRKRVWWTLFAGDGFAALVAGHAPTIRLEDITVTEPLDIDDNSTPSVEFQSVEVRDDGSLKPVTTYSFHRYRTKLYWIAARLGTRRNVSQHSFEDETRRIFDELDQLRKTLPSELSLDSYVKLGPVDEHKQFASRVFRLQALTLRILCEHIQLLLFRSFIGDDSEADSPLTHGTATTAYTESTPDDNNTDMASMARALCFQSSMRIARVDQHPDILRMASYTPLVTHLGVLSFTAGAILGTLALLNPTSTHARECKLGLARIIKLPKICSFSNALWDQATETLKDVLRVICSEEVETLLVGDFPPSPAQSADDEIPATMSSSRVLVEESLDTAELVDDSMGFPGTDLTGFADMEVFAECYTAFTDLYGPSIGLNNVR